MFILQGGKCSGAVQERGVVEITAEEGGLRRSDLKSQSCNGTADQS